MDCVKYRLPFRGRYAFLWCVPRKRETFQDTVVVELGSYFESFSKFKSYKISGSTTIELIKRALLQKLTRE